MKDRLRERAHQIDMAKNGFSLPWAKKHLSPLLCESADRIEALENLVRDMRNVLNPPCADTCPHCECKGCPDYDEVRVVIERRVQELGVI